MLYSEACPGTAVFFTIDYNLYSKESGSMIRMHPSTSKDPVLAHPLPIITLVPIAEQTLKNAKVKYTREEIINRFMKGKPRVAVLISAPDHPQYLADLAIHRLVVEALWEKGAVPFTLSIPCLNQMAALGHGGMHFDLATRNTTTGLIVSQLEAHGYDAAVAIASGELTPVAALAAFVEVDIYRRNTKRPPFYAFFIPPTLTPDRPVPKAIKELLRPLRDKIEHPGLRRELEFLMAARLRPNMYPMFYKLLEHPDLKKHLSKAKKDQLLLAIASSICDKPGTPPFMENSNTNRIVLHGLGLVPKGMDLLITPPDSDAMGKMAASFLKAITGRKDDLSVSNIAKANLENAVRLWTALSGSTDWTLHFSYLTSFMNILDEEQLSPTYIAALCSETPTLGMFTPTEEPSLYQWASEIAAGNTGGLDTVMKVLHSYDSDLVENVQTIDGTWENRHSTAPEADGVLIKTEPASESMGIVELRGNFCESSVARIAGLSPEEMERFDKKTYLAVFYYNEEDALADLFESSEILEKVKTIVTMDDLLSLFQLNYPDRLDDYKMYSKLKKDALFDRLVDDKLMRIFVVVAGEGPVANGMRQIYYPAEYLHRDVRLRHITVLCTDGRIAGLSWGPFVGHSSPEGMEGGGIAAIETGELVYIDFENGIMNALDKDSSFDLGKIVLLSKNEIQRRPLGSMRQKKMVEDRLALPLSLRSVLNAITPTTSGAAPFLGR